MNTQQLTRHALAMRLQLQHDNDRLRDALQIIAEIAATSSDPKSMPNIGRIARAALVGATPANPTLARETT
ncbi:hypothetical protein [Paraburkholderia bannensis]|uniref:hypothetical protein n=1 Tax=Paraburkholderia bannensis TaxID=765414 RepID=UPI002AC34717|nr:hypothetical protein [Paraburkholderia bannensis]